MCPRIADRPIRLSPPPKRSGAVRGDLGGGGAGAVKRRRRRPVSQSYLDHRELGLAAAIACLSGALIAAAVWLVRLLG